MAAFSGHPTLQALLQKGEDEGTLEFGEIAAAVEELELEEGALDAFYAEAERRGIEVLDARRRGPTSRRPASMRPRSPRPPATRSSSSCATSPSARC